MKFFMSEENWSLKEKITGRAGSVTQDHLSEKQTDKWHPKHVI